MKTKPLTCTLGFHQVTGDSAMFSSVDKCSCCSWVGSKAMADELARERALWARHKNAGSSLEDAMQLVFQDFNAGVDPRT